MIWRRKLDGGENVSWHFNRKETCEFVVVFFAMQVFRLGSDWNVNFPHLVSVYEPADHPG